MAAAETTTPTSQDPSALGRLQVVAAGLLAAIVAGVLVLSRDRPVERSESDVPLGVEEAVVIRYSGPRLVVRPYRRGASINLRIAGEFQEGDVRVYDVRYIVNLPGTFELTDYLTAADGRPIDDLPKFQVRGLTSLTKDIDTRIREIQDVRIDIGSWYYEVMAGLGVFWIAWLLALIFVGRKSGPAAAAPPPPPPTLADAIAAYLDRLGVDRLGVAEKARFEALMLRYLRDRLDRERRPRMAGDCRRIRDNGADGETYGKLEAWLHDPISQVSCRELSEEIADLVGVPAGDPSS